VRVEILEPDVLYAEAKLPASLEKVVTFLGQVFAPPPAEEVAPPPEEEVTPPAPAPPAPAPVCTIGDTKCDGYDLYQCQEVSGAAAWVLKEKNSASCGYVPPTPPVPPPTPPPAVKLAGTIDSIQWQYENIWHDISEAMPAGKTILHRFNIVNSGTQATFKVGQSYFDAFQNKFLWVFSPEKVIDTGEGFVDWQKWTGAAQSIDVEFYLYANGYQVDSRTVKLRIIEWEE